MRLIEQEEIEKWQKQAKKENKVLILLVAGDSASGKSSRISLFHLSKILTSTTRSPRRGEKNGRDYEFLSEEEFDQAQNQGQFLETTNYGWHKYGTKLNQFLDKIDQLKPCYMILDVFGVANVKNILNLKYSENFLVKTIYYQISKQTFLKRITHRGENSDPKYIENRWSENENARTIINNNPSLFDLIIDANKNIKKFEK